MKNLHLANLLIVSTFILFSCKDEPILNTTGISTEGQWLIPKGLVRDAGPGWDGIPAIVNPELVSISEIQYLEEDDLVIGIQTAEGVRIYPHRILDWHEIINDQAGPQHFAVNYCPLTGTGMAWDRFQSGKLVNFRVSGFLYNSNLMLFDDRTLSIWSQMLSLCVNGDMISLAPEDYPIIESSWKHMKDIFPEAQVVSLNTGFDRPYHTYPYLDPLSGADYREEPWLIAHIEHGDDRLNRKERVLGIVEKEKGRVYRLNEFGEGVSLLYDEFQDQKVVIAGSQDKNFMLAFYPTTQEGDPIVLQAISGSYPVIMIDSEGNKWDVFGHAVEGPREGQQLARGKSYMGFFFAWATIFENVEIYGQ